MPWTHFPDDFDPRAPGSPFRADTPEDRGDAAWDRITDALEQIEQDALDYARGDYSDARDLALAEYFAADLTRYAAELGARIRRAVNAGRGVA